MNVKTLLTDIINDLRVDLTAEFDRNFERKGFFNDPWPDTKHGNHRGSLMIRSGDLRRGLESDIDSGIGVRFTNSMPYATIHNEGGTTHPTVTPKMRAWAWAMHKETGEDWYKHIALTKKDKLEVKIPKRQFIGDHPEVHKIVEECISTNMDDFLKQFDAEIRR
jgi:phage gpG-like protein